MQNTKEINKFLRKKKLLAEDSESFVMTPEISGEISLIELLEEYSTLNKQQLAADFDNYKKRVNKEKEELKNKTKIETLEGIIELDNDIDIALKNTKQNQDKGLLLIKNKVDKFLEKQGIEKIQTNTYDPDLHEVISLMPSEKDKDGEILNVLSNGYMLNGKPIKYPKIILSKCN